MSQMVDVLNGLQAKFKRREARMSQPDPTLVNLRSRVQELEQSKGDMIAQMEEMKRRLEESEAKALQEQEHEEKCAQAQNQDDY